MANTGWYRIVSDGFERREVYYKRWRLQASRRW